jgi:hypothetical protein
MNIETTHSRHCAVSMELAAYLDGHYVEMHILTDTGKTISIVCERDSIFSVQRNIERMGRDCPEIATWKPGTYIEKGCDSNRRPVAALNRRVAPRAAQPLVIDAAWADWNEALQ